MLSITRCSKSCATPKNNGPSIVKILICGQSCDDVTTCGCTCSLTVLWSGNAFSTTEILLIRFANNTNAKINPTITAVVILVNTVNKTVTANTSASPDFIFKKWTSCLRSAIFQATISNTGAILANGIWEAYGATAKTVTKTNTP